MNSLPTEMPSRVPLGVFPTPLQRSIALGRLLGVSNLWVKRDDLTGFSWGGNKVRTAEFLLADALAAGATELVVAGGPSSNFVAIMAAAADVHGLGIHRVSYGNEPLQPVAAFEQAKSCGVTTTFTGSTNRSQMDDLVRTMAADRADFGQVAYPIPRGGSTAIGAMGFLTAGYEIVDQMETMDVQPNAIVLPVGSGGSAAGLLAAAAILDVPWKIIGASVSRPPAAMKNEIVDKAQQTARLAGVGLKRSNLAKRLKVHDGRGPGFGKAGPETAVLATAISAQTGLMIDATYNAKALHWLKSASATLDHESIVYWFTGGALNAIDSLIGHESLATEPASS